MFFRHPLHIVLGLTIWAIWFVVMYSLLSISCHAVSTNAQALNWITLLLLGCTLSTCIVLIGLVYIYWQVNKRANSTLSRFIVWVSMGGYLVAIIATISMGIMVLFFPPCL